MTESRISCSKCGGHIVFPKELAGQEVVCPHCNETILLPKSKSAMPWIVAGVFALITVCLAVVLVLQLPKNHKVTPTARAIEPAKSSQDESTKNSGQVKNSEDDEAIKNLCKEFYDGLNNQDANALYNLLATSCQKALGIEDMKKLYDGGAKYEFIDLDSVKYQTSALGMAAMAKVKRKRTSKFVVFLVRADPIPNKNVWLKKMTSGAVVEANASRPLPSADLFELQ